MNNFFWGGAEGSVSQNVPVIFFSVENYAILSLHSWDSISESNIYSVDFLSYMSMWLCVPMYSLSSHITIQGVTKNVYTL